MTIDVVIIPSALFADGVFNDLPTSDKMFLVDLYVRYGDCDIFTIDLSNPSCYGQTFTNVMCRRVKKLVDSGLLVVAGKVQNTTLRLVRLFEFKYFAQDINDLPRRR